MVPFPIFFFSYVKKICCWQPLDVELHYTQSRTYGLKAQVGIIRGFLLALWPGSIRIRCAGGMFGFPRLVYSPRYSRERDGDADYLPPLFPMTLSDREWLSEILNDAKHGAVSRRQLSFLYHQWIIMLNSINTAISYINLIFHSKIMWV